jgi:uncharacterized protein YceK
MARIAFLLMLIAAAVSLPGCGTLSDILAGPIDDHFFYRGVRFDLAVMKQDGLGPLDVVDLPFSAVADTALLPYCVCVWSARLALKASHPEYFDYLKEPGLSQPPSLGKGLEVRQEEDRQAHVPEVGASQP